MLPKDPYMLLSVINTELRDNYESLEDLVRAYDIEMQSVTEPLQKAGYSYNPELNAFVQE